jgi:hypothetical protein
MNLIQNPTTVSPAEQILLAQAARSTDALASLKQAAVTSFRELWYHPTVTAAEQLAVMGTNAVQAFTLHGKTVQYLIENGIELDPEDYTPPAEYTPHPDGTITINQP